MAAVLASLAPEEPHVDIVVQVFLWLCAVLVDLLSLEVIHSVEYGNWLEANGTGGYLVAAVLAPRILHVCVVFVIQLLLL